MKKILFCLIVIFSFLNCNQQIPSTTSNEIEGTWKMVYAEIFENDTIKSKDLSNTSFIKIINKTHFSFFNQENSGNRNFYSGAGSYVLEGGNYKETLNFTTIESFKNHEFSFNVKIKGDTLIQTGIEKISGAGVNRYITEKYIKLNE